MEETAQHRAFWQEGVERRRYPQMDGDVRCHTLVVGAGITGLTAAMRLVLTGRNVVVIDMNRVGGGTTGYSTGHLDNHYDRRLRKLIDTFGTEDAERVIDAKRQAIAHIETWVDEFRMNCDFVRVAGYLYTEQEDDASVKDEHDAAWEIGHIPSLLEGAPLPFETRHAARFEDQARLSPLKYIVQLARAFADSGGVIYENTRMHDFEEMGSRVLVSAGNYKVQAEHLILAGHTSLVGKLTVQPRISAYQSFVLGVEVEDTVEDALYWDTETPYHYTRIASSDTPRTLIIGGADQRTGSGDDMRRSFGQLEEYARRRYNVRRITHYWSHEFFEPADGLPYAGRAPLMDHTRTAAAFSGDGLTMGTVCGNVLADQILQKENALSEIVAPDRVKPLASARQLSKTLTHAVKHYVHDRVARYAHSVEEIEPGTGGVIKEHGNLYAVYKGPAGDIDVLSPVCRHMGCIVHWNNAEETWDCPCHGGRYDKHGNVIMGPPREPLQKKALKTHAPA
ncbi:MAG: FAD-dependent oxidoreductase [Phycisphaerae bacterium]|nr:FAD-dependent oxidoreductase [Phycisphaerae bacterium]